MDTTIIDASSSTRNKGKKRNLEMHSAKKGNQWRFGMKCHIGVDAGSGLVHTIVTTSANIHDVTMASELIREDDEVVYGDSGYLDIQKRLEVANDEHLSTIDYRINLHSGRFPKVSNSAIVILKSKNPLSDAKWSTYSESSNASLGTGKSDTGDLRKTKIGCMPCLPVRISTLWPLLDESCTRHSRGFLYPFLEGSEWIGSNLH